MSHKQKPLVLVIDPDPKTATTLSPRLDAEGFRSATCSGIARSMSAVRRWRPDLVIVGKETVNCDGMILIGRIKKLFPGTRAILCVEPGDWPSLLDATDAGADELQGKQSDPEDLLESVHRLLDPVRGQAHRMPTAKIRAG